MNMKVRILGLTFLQPTILRHQLPFGAQTRACFLRHQTRSLQLHSLTKLIATLAAASSTGLNSKSLIRARATEHRHALGQFTARRMQIAGTVDRLVDVSQVGYTHAAKVCLWFRM